MDQFTETLERLKANLEVAPHEPEAQQLPKSLKTSSDTLMKPVQNNSPVLSVNQDARKKVGVIIEQCYHTLHRYGRDSYGLPNVIRMFDSFLGGYSGADVVKAFEYYVKNNSQFPTPSDIIAILEKRVKLDASVYRRLIERQKAGEYLMDTETDYIKKY